MRSCNSQLDAAICRAVAIRLSGLSSAGSGVQEPLKTTPILIIYDDVSLASCSQDVTRPSKSVQRIHSSVEMLRSNPASNLNDDSVKSRMVAEPSRCSPQRVRKFLPAHHQKKSSGPSAKNSSPFSPLVVLAFERLRLVLRRKHANPLLLL